MPIKCYFFNIVPGLFASGAIAAPQCKNDRQHHASGQLSEHFPHLLYTYGSMNPKVLYRKRFPRFLPEQQAVCEVLSIILSIDGDSIDVALSVLRLGKLNLVDEKRVYGLVAFFCAPRL